MAEICPISSGKFGYAVAGVGPAGCGFLLHAIKANAIEQLVEGGLVVIDRDSRPGAGKVGDYQLTGNSLSRAFLDCFDDPDLAWLFDETCQNDPSVRQLRAMEFEAPPLDVVGDFLRLLARRTLDHLKSRYGIPILLETEIARIQHQESGDYILHLRNRDTGQASRIVARNVVCALGGRQGRPVVEETEIVPGLKLGAATRNLMVSDDFLTWPDDAVRAAIPIDKNAADIVIVGGSHSAISTIDRVTQALAPVGLKSVTMLHTSPLRLYYASPEEALAEDYPFLDPEDICPMSGRVNRFGGLRYRSLDVAKSILKTGRMPEHDVAVNWLRLRSSAPLMIKDALAEAPAVIACMGYQANLPPVVDEEGNDITLCNWPRGVEVDDEGRIETVCQGPMPGMFAIGIGSTLLRRSDAIGGEPSFRGVADGVWLYHNHGGGVILSALDHSFSSQEALYAETHRVPRNAQVY